MTNKEFRERHGMLPKGCRVLAAVSGGADSVYLLCLLKSLEPEITVYAAHFEHGIRGEESLRDCRFVEELCEELHVPCTVGHGDVPAYAKEQGKGIEESAREMRYAFLEQTAEKLNCDRIATGHNADDNAETVLFHLARGTGTAGLCGIPPVRGKIIRPLLNVPREEIERFLREKRIAFVEDSSNSGDAYARNRIRHAVMPALKEVNEGFLSNLNRTTELLSSDEEYLQACAEDFLTVHGNGNAVDKKPLAELHPAVAGRVVRKLAGDIGSEHVAAVLRLAQGSGLGYADIPGMRVRREKDRMYFGDRPAGEIPETEIRPETVTAIPGTDYEVSTSYGNCGEEIHNSFKTYELNCERIIGRISCTGWRPGDQIRPLGRGCTKSLKKLFLEAGLTRDEKSRTPVFRDGQGVIAVGTLGMDERCAAKPGDRVLILRLRKTGD